MGRYPDGGEGRYGHGTRARWTSECRCPDCRQAHADAERSRKQAKAQTRLPAKSGSSFSTAFMQALPFRTIVRDLGLTSQQVWGLTKTDQAWSTTRGCTDRSPRTTAWNTAPTLPTRTAACAGIAEEHQQRRMGRNRGS